MAKAHPLVLVIENEPSLLRYLRAILQSSGFLVQMAGTVPEGHELVGRLSPDLVLWDLDLDLDLDSDPAHDLLEGCRAPIIALSDRGREEDVVRALDAGVDDYLVKPFGARELVARIRVALRHSVLEAGTGAGPSVEVGPLQVDFVDREISRDGVPVPLTRREFALLAILIQHAGKVVTHEQLRYEILGAPARSDALLRAHIAHLRQKLEADPGKPSLILTRPGLGYCLGLGGVARATQGPSSLPRNGRPSPLTGPAVEPALESSWRPGEG